MNGATLTHLDADGRASMVDVGNKDVTRRTAKAEGFVRMAAETLDLVARNGLKKGDVVSVARLAGIMGAKRTADLIPLCHPLMLEKIGVEIDPEPSLPGLRVVATVSLSGRTGVEMEALTAVSVACLAIYDMAKAVDRGMEITGLRVLEKAGGRSGDWSVEAPPA